MSEKLTKETFKEISLDVKLVRSVGSIRRGLIMDFIDNRLPKNQEGYTEASYPEISSITGFIKVSTVCKDISDLIALGFLEKKSYGYKRKGYKATTKYNKLKK